MFKHAHVSTKKYTAQNISHNAFGKWRSDRCWILQKAPHTQALKFDVCFHLPIALGSFVALYGIHVNPDAICSNHNVYQLSKTMLNSLTRLNAFATRIW